MSVGFSGCVLVYVHGWVGRGLISMVDLQLVPPPPVKTVFNAPVHIEHSMSTVVIQPKEDAISCALHSLSSYAAC